MTGYVNNIEKLALENTNFRQVVYTSQHAQIVLMSLKPKEEIGMETHAYTDQFFRVEKGQGKVIMNGEETPIADGTAILIPAGTKHNVVNLSETEEMKLYTIYAPPHHVDGVVHPTKEAANSDTTDHL